MEVFPDILFDQEDNQFMFSAFFFTIWPFLLITSVNNPYIFSSKNKKNILKIC